MTIANIVIICNAVAHISSPNMDLGSIAQGILESDVTQAQKMTRAWKSLHPNLT